jgi:CheY-like chemotaxis protein
MPVMDGNEATAKIRRELRLTQLPIIALTAGALVAERQRSFDAGMTDFLSKPLDPPALIRTVSRHVTRARGGSPTSLPFARPPAPDPVQPLALAPAWPAIEGIDAADAAARLGHDVALFATLLGHLVRELPELAADATVTPELVARLHKLRGAAGTLGARPIQRLAGELERALKLDLATPDAPRLLRELAAALAALAGHARPFLDARRAEAAARRDGEPAPRRDDDADPATATATAIDPAIDHRAVQELYELFVQQDLAAIDRFRALIVPLRAACGGARFHDLSEAVERFEFARAADLIAGASASSRG